MEPLHLLEVPAAPGQADAAVAQDNTCEQAVAHTDVVPLPFQAAPCFGRAIRACGVQGQGLKGIQKLLHHTGQQLEPGNGGR